MPTVNDQIRRRTLILDRLHLRGLTQAALARKANVSRGLVCHVIAGRKTHKGVQTLLARACGMRFTELWED